MRIAFQKNNNGNSFLVFAALLVLLSSCQPNKESANDLIFISDISTIDAKNGIQENQTVVLQGNQIVDIIKQSDLRQIKSSKIIDGAGKYLIPGLWDTHIHFAYIEDLAPSMFDLFLAYGVTSVRDTGGKIDFVKKWKDKADKFPKSSPRIKIAGPLLDGEPNVYDGSPGRPELSVGLEDEDAAIKMVDSLHKKGVDLLKAYEMLSPTQFAAITKRAKKLGLLVTGHVPLSMDVISAVEAGMNSMEHMRNLEFSTAKNWESLLEQRRKLLAEGIMDQGGVLRSRIHDAQRTISIENQDESQTQKVLKILAKNNVYQIPTLSIMTLTTNRPFQNTAFLDSYKYLPSSIEEKWRAGAKTILDSPIQEKRKKYTNWSHDIINKANQAGVKILAGTDAPIGFLTPGLSLHDELYLLSKSGLSNMEILESATSAPAAYFDLQAELGLIEKGMIADLLILDANPLEDIRNTQKINSVIKDGNILDRRTLDQMFAKLDRGN